MSRPASLPADPDDRWLAIRARLEPHAEQLARQGGLTSRLSGSRRVWSIRLVDRSAGKAVHRAIYLGDDDEIVNRAKRLLAFWRSEGQLGTEAVQFAKQALQICGALRRAIGRPRRQKGFAAGCGGDRH